MGEIPSLDAVASAALLVGLLFLLRYGLVMRRIWRARGERPQLAFAEHVRTFSADAFGPEHEPERRYAARQLALGLACAGAGLVLFAWLLAAGLLVGF